MAVGAGLDFARPLVILRSDGETVEGGIGVLTLLGDDWALAAGHVLEERERGSAPDRIAFYGARDCRPVEEIALPDYDLVALRLEPAPEGRAPIWRSPAGLGPGSPVCCLGQGTVSVRAFMDRRTRRLRVPPDGIPPIPAWPAPGVVVASGDGEVVVEAGGLIPTHSGGPIVDRWGRLVSVATERTAEIENVDGAKVSIALGRCPSPTRLAGYVEEATDLKTRPGGRLRALVQGWRR